MKKKLLLLAIAIIAILGTLLTEHLIQSSKQSAEMEKYRKYLNENYIPLHNKMTKYLSEANQAIIMSSWYDLENGFVDGQKLKDDINKVKEELTRKEAAYPKTQELKKALLNNLDTYEGELALIDTSGDNTDENDFTEDKDLKSMIKSSLKMNKENIDKILKFYK